MSNRPATQIFSAVLLSVVLLSGASTVTSSDNPQQLQQVSVTILAGKHQGSGVLITRNVTGADGKVRKRNFVLTCGHICEHLKTAVYNQQGAIAYYTWKEAEIVQAVVKGGRTIGFVKLKAEVFLYSHAEKGHDLALLLIKGDKVIDVDTTFDLTDVIPGVGTDVFHVGSAKGEHQSLTSGIISFVGRVGKFKGTDNAPIFDQACVSALPGSSGGGIWKEDGEYIGMLVRQVSENFNIIVPIRRIKVWATENNVQWVLDPKVAMPSLEDINKLPKEAKK